MRCPYCKGVNADNAPFCVYCGRDLRPTYTQSRLTGTQGRPTVTPPPVQPARSQAQPTTARVRNPQPQSPVVAPVITAPPAPEPPAPFPPRTMEQLRALEKGALDYRVLDSSVSDGRKKIVRIVFSKAAPWQQVATLLKAFREQQESRFERILIQGIFDPNTSIYAYTNGQLCFDRNVRLGATTNNRYQIETGSGLESDSVRIILNE
ncbi:MAG TPA: zinc ribbon domain-containing protein [Ktedonobacteraceae bacterium]|nr:zinc ribbon domain-containing protein [Ktedonobacteraceae bacterium]